MLAVYTVDFIHDPWDILSYLKNFIPCILLIAMVTKGELVKILQKTLLADLTTIWH